MRRLFLMTAMAAASTVVLPALIPTSARADDPGFVDRTEWVEYGPEYGPENRMASLRVYPTVSGRAAAARPGSFAEAEAAWHEVLARSPEADTPGMRDQFLCHWQFAEFASPGKLSWNLEPWRPVVDGVTMFGTGCNPGGAEERL